MVASVVVSVVVVVVVVSRSRSRRSRRSSRSSRSSGGGSSSSPNSDQLGVLISCLRVVRSRLRIEMVYTDFGGAKLKQHSKNTGFLGLS